MAYQSVATPRFYINAYEFANAFGNPSETDEAYMGSEYLSAWEWANDNDFDSILNTLPTQTYSASLWDNNQPLYNFPPFYNPFGDYYDNNFVAFLGHNLSSWDKIVFDLPSTLAYPIVNIELSTPFLYIGSLFKKNLQGQTNGGDGGQGELGNFRTAKKGFSIIGWNHLVPTMWNCDKYNLRLGSVICGSFYDMENSPNLSLSIEYDYGNIKETTTQNGGSISNKTQDKSPKWDDAGAWELYQYTPALQSLSRSGRRTWDLKFSYLDDSDLWGSNQMIGGNREDFTDGLNKDDIVGNISNYKYNLITDDNFFSQVWYKTFGGTLPFIFQPDKNNNNPDQFAICRFKDDSLKATQTAFNVYDISLTIEETY